MRRPLPQRRAPSRRATQIAVETARPPTGSGGKQLGFRLSKNPSSLQATKPVDFPIYTPEGTAPSEYQVLKLRVSKNTREFRSSTGGVFHTSTGATRDSVKMTPTKVGPRRYTFTLDPATPAGECGVLPPGFISTSNAASGGKLYTFRVLE